MGVYEWHHPDSHVWTPVNQTNYHKKCHANGCNEQCIKRFLRLDGNIHINEYIFYKI